MTKPFIFDRRHGYFDAQDIEPDHRFALMRWSGTPTLLDDLEERLTNFKIKFKTRKWGGWGRAKPDNSKPRRKEHRHV